MRLKRDKRAGAFPFVAVLTPSSLLPWHSCPPGSPSVGVSGSAQLTSSAWVSGPKLDLPRTCHARNVWAVKEWNPTWHPLQKRLSRPHHDGAQYFCHSMVPSWVWELLFYEIFILQFGASWSPVCFSQLLVSKAKITASKNSPAAGDAA